MLFLTNAAWFEKWLTDELEGFYQPPSTTTTMSWLYFNQSL